MNVESLVRLATRNVWMAYMAHQTLGTLKEELIENADRINNHLKDYLFESLSWDDYIFIMEASKDDCLGQIKDRLRMNCGLLPEDGGVSQIVQAYISWHVQLSQLHVLRNRMTLATEEDLIRVKAELSSFVQSLRGDEVKKFPLPLVFGPFADQVVVLLRQALQEEVEIT